MELHRNYEEFIRCVRMFNDIIHWYIECVLHFSLSEMHLSDSAQPFTSSQQFSFVYLNWTILNSHWVLYILWGKLFIVLKINVSYTCWLDIEIIVTRMLHNIKENQRMCSRKTKRDFEKQIFCCDVNVCVYLPVGFMWEFLLIANFVGKLSCLWTQFKKIEILNQANCLDSIKLGI